MGGGGLEEILYRGYFEAQHLKRIARFKHTMNVLELGCGNGRWALTLAPLVKHYTAVDFSRPALDIARQNISKAGLLNVDVREQSIVGFQGDRLYDVIYFGGVTQYLQDPEILQILGHLAPWMKPCTIIVDRSTICYQQRQINEEGPYISIYRTPRELEHLFFSHGFRKIYQRRSYRFLRSGLIGRVKNLCPSRFRDWSVIVRRGAPLSFYMLLWITWAEDLLRPVPWAGGERSHDFFVFSKEGPSHASI